MVARLRDRRRRKLRGFTLVEMLVSMVLTLIMVWAIAEFYARVGEAVKDGRAMIEARNQLRVVTQQLKADLDLVTVVPAPPINDSILPGFAVEGQGYIEYVEGAGSDSDPEGDGFDIYPAGGNGIPDIADDVIPPGGNNIPDFIETTSAPGLLGDIDDYLGFTIRSSGEPFVAPAIGANSAGVLITDSAGNPVVAMAASMYAEVAWWTSFTDLTTYATPGGWDLAEPRSIHRRLLLVRPDVNAVRSGDAYSGPFYVKVPAPSATRLPEIYFTLMQYSDVSIRPLGYFGGHCYFAANSLADLTRRENRFMHENELIVDPADPNPPFFPWPLDLNPRFGLNAAYAGAASPPRAAMNNRTSQYRWVLGGNRRGEDVILSNVLAFDVRAFDPTVVLHQDTIGGGPTPADALQPGDAGYGAAATYPVAGYGAYVDLFYGRYTSGTSVFSAAPVGNSGFRYDGMGIPLPFLHRLPDPMTTGVPFFDRRAVYCTWAASYGRDGINQDGDMATDEGADGLDNDDANGVDDAGESETIPPYPVRLRGLEVKVRTYEPGTRQVQQGTVGTDFIPE